MRLALLGLFLPLIAACSGTTHEVMWQVTFSHGVPAGAVVVHMEVREGSCVGPARVAYDLDLTSHMATALVQMNVSAGMYCVYAEARDMGCGAVGKGMTALFMLPTSAPIVVDVTSVPPGPGVCPGMCTAGHCPTPDAGSDGGVRDATSDATASDMPPTDMTGVDVPVMDMDIVDMPGADMPVTMMDMGPPDMPLPACAGCFTGTTCNAGIGNTTCGSGGGMCASCTATEECVGQTCVPRFAHFAASPADSFLLRANGSLYSAGDDAHLQRGLRTGVSPMFSLEPLTPAPAGSVVAVGTTQFATCAISAVGRLFCWGNNGYGLLGFHGSFDSTFSTDTPTMVGSGVAIWVAIDGGTQHFCAIQSDGSLWCWGDNAAGQLGTGASSAFAPQHVGSSTWLQVSAGDVGTCAVRSDHGLYCWGDNAHGQLGIGSTTAATTPSAVAHPTGLGWASVSTEGTHTCAIDAGGHLYCWGDYRYGQLGLGALAADVLSPRLVGGAADSWLVVSAGQYHSCGVRRAGGAHTDGLCWGSNAFGEIGDGSGSGEQDAPVLVVPSPADWASVAAGWQMTCATSSLGAQPQCWGSNALGKLGIGADPATTLSVTTPTSVSPPGL